MIILNQLNVRIREIHNSITTSIDSQPISNHINNLNTGFVDHVCNLASTCFKKSKNNPQKSTKNNPWFNWHAKLAKRELRKATKATSDFPSSDFLRHNFYKVKKITKN